MTAKYRVPDCYKTPLRSRKAIAAYLDSIGGYCGTYYSEGSYFAFNVKCYRVDLDFDHLLDVFRESGDYGPDERWLDDPVWLDRARERYAEIGDSLFQWALDDVRAAVFDSDCWTFAFSGDKLDVSYLWLGRSGGYLGIESFEGFDFSDSAMSREAWRETFEGAVGYDGRPRMSYATLRRLYGLIVMLEHDWTPAKASAEVERTAAWILVDGVDRSDPRFDPRQLLLPLEYPDDAR